MIAPVGPLPRAALRARADLRGGARWKCRRQRRQQSTGFEIDREDQASPRRPERCSGPAQALMGRAQGIQFRWAQSQRLCAGSWRAENLSSTRIDIDRHAGGGFGCLGKHFDWNARARSGPRLGNRRRRSSKADGGATRPVSCQQPVSFAYF